ncbi:hypothetical protein ZIOFF_028713 [Zingiber officinale]|uniref:Uncharacterized protein n=1 Tax=Zingiber officinale TaxID=94328 RepID=A0A8J5L3Q8_ZINOF|nr:hypothetical protein ZIOFF_028713 [Zingiber officinale]
MASKKGLEDFDAVFGEATPECDAETSALAAAAARPFLFYAHSPDPSCLEVVATDFHSHTFSRLFTAHDLEDLVKDNKWLRDGYDEKVNNKDIFVLVDGNDGRQTKLTREENAEVSHELYRDDIGIGGSWSEFIDYLNSSLSYGNVKLILGSSHNRDSGTDHANMIAFKSKGLPRISLSLSKISNDQAIDAIAKLSLSLFNAFKKKNSDALKGVFSTTSASTFLLNVLDARLQSSSSIIYPLSVAERSDNLQKQLESLSFLSKRKTPKLKSSDILANSETINSETTSNSGLQQPLADVIAAEITAIRAPEPIKINHRGVPRGPPVPNRSRVRGASLQTSKDDADD